MTMTTEQMVIELKSVTYDLISLLERENQGMRAIPMQEYERFINDKTALCMRYEQLVTTLRKHGDELKKLPTEIRAELRELQERFHDVADKNRIVLLAMRRTTDHIVKTIVDSIKKQAASDFSPYDKYGNAASAPISSYSKPQQQKSLSVSLNKTL